MIPVLITNNHVLKETDIKLFQAITLKINDGNFQKHLTIDPDRLTFTDEKLDVTIIEIKPFDWILHFLDKDDNLLRERP